MDPVTHAAGGALLALALPRHPAARWAVPLAALVSQVPDLDIFLARTPEAFLALHRGITHSFAVLPLLALVLALCCAPLWKGAVPKGPAFARAWLLCATCLLLHIWLDCITTYGTMPLLPFSAQRVRLNAVFIVDPFLTPVMLAALVPALRRRSRGRTAALLGILWLAAYPAANMALDHVHGQALAEELRGEGRDVAAMALLPDVLAPLRTRALCLEGSEDKAHVRDLSLDITGRPLGLVQEQAALDAGLARRLAAQSPACALFLDFLILPVVRPVPDEDLEGSGETAASLRERGRTALLVHDLRFDSGLAFVRRLMALRPNAQIPFRLMVILDGQGTILKERLHFSDSRKDTGWREPAPLPPVTLLRRLVGLSRGE